MPTILGQGTKDYSAYVVDQVNQLNTGGQGSSTRPSSRATSTPPRRPTRKARPFYERAESSVEGFVLPGFAVDDNAGNLDYLIDMRESTPVDDKVGWKGFHAIERDLWQGGAITAGTKALSTELVGNVGKLVAVVATPAVQARGPRQRRRRPDRRGAEHQDHR